MVTRCELEIMAQNGKSMITDGSYNKLLTKSVDVLMIDHYNQSVELD